MTFAYDLVIIGNTQEAIYAAIVANSWKARVALVTQSLILTEIETIYALSLNTYASHNSNFTVNNKNNQDCLNNYHLLAKAAISTISETYNPALLSAWGIDVIVGKGGFVNIPQTTFIVNDRILKSRCYLLATGCTTKIPNLDNIENIGYLTPKDIVKKDNFDSISQNLAIIGHSFLSLELAQSLAKMGKKVTLINNRERLLPKEDLEIAMLIQAQLESDGVEIYNKSPITQVKVIEGQKWLQAGDYAISVDDIIFSDYLQPNIQDLNLESVKVKYNQQGIIVNSKLQTTNPRIYACGSMLGGYNLTHIGQYEAKIAIKNALFLPLFTVNYNYLPWVMLTQPNLARIGMNATQAQSFYGENVIIAQSYYKNLPLAQITQETTGFCQIITLNNGEILGACIIGKNATELIVAIALAMESKFKIEKLGQFFAHNLSYAAIIQETVNHWQQQKVKKTIFKQNLLKNWFKVKN